MTQFLYGFAGTIAALLLAVAWRHRFGAPMVYGLCALVGSYALGWLVGRGGADAVPFLVAGLLAGGGVFALAVWIELEFKALGRERQG